LSLARPDPIYNLFIVFAFARSFGYAAQAVKKVSNNLACFGIYGIKFGALERRIANLFDIRIGKVLSFELFYIFIGQAGYLGLTFTDKELAIQSQFKAHPAIAFCPVLVRAEIRFGSALPETDEPFAPFIVEGFRRLKRGYIPLVWIFRLTHNARDHANRHNQQYKGRFFIRDLLLFQ
jgi:hypothetical protein